MNFVVSSSELLSKLQVVGRVIASKNTLPILDCFLFGLEENKLVVTASDLETTMISNIHLTNTKGEGAIAIESKRLLDILKEFSEQPLTFEIDSTSFSIEIHSQHGKYTLIGQSPDEYPKIPELNAESISFSLQSEVLFSGIAKTLFATANDELRPIMNGIYIEMEENLLTFVATDAQKLVRYKRNDVTIQANGGFILPKKPANLLKTVLQKIDGDITVSVDKKNAKITSIDNIVICRLVDGTYPAYNTVIPKQNPNKVSVDRFEFYNTLKRVSVFSNPATNLIRLEINGNDIKISAEDIDFSISAYENAVCQYDGEPLEIGFRSIYLLEVLANLSSQEIRMELSEPNKAGLIFPVETENEGEDILMLLMPMMLG